MKIARKNYFNTSKCPGQTNILYVLYLNLTSIAPLQFIIFVRKHGLHTST